MQPQQDPHKPGQKPGLVPGPRGGMLHEPFAKGNPGGSAPKGKRVSTWMAEYGETPDKYPPTGSDKFKALPLNAQIALKRLRCAVAEDTKTNNSEYVEPRSRPVEDSAPPSAPMLTQIAAAILALKAAGVEIRRPIVATPEPVDVTPTEEEDEDQRTKRFRRGRS